MLRIPVPLLFLVLVPISRQSHAEDWTEFRGPTGQGHASAVGLPLHWSETENVAWSVPVPGLGWSSPVVVDDRIYLTTAVPRGGGEPTKQSLRALCLDAGTGHEMWNVEVFAQDGTRTPRIHNKNSHASATPLIDGKRLFVHFGTEGTACLSLSGESIWTTRELKYSPVHGNGGSPVLADDVLIVNCDGSDLQFVAALEKQTGEIRWKKSRIVLQPNKFAFGTPLLIDVDGQPQLISPGTDVVTAYDPHDGREIWSVNYDGYSIIPRPVFGHGLVFICTGYDRPSILAIRPDGTGNVTITHVAWQVHHGAPHTPSLLLVGDELYSVSDRGGVALCLDARTGKQHWQERLGGSYSASPLYADGRIYFQSEKGVTTVIEASTEFHELAKNVLPGRTLASFAVADRALLIRTDERLYRVEDLD